MLTSQQGMSYRGSDQSFSSPTLWARGQDTGVRLSEDSLLHLGIGADAGFDTNVFYEEDDPVQSPFVRITPFIQVTNATRDGTRPSAVFYDLTASLAYREYLSNDENAKAQRAFNPAVTGLVSLSSNRTVSFTVADTFTRIEDPPYGANQGSITRDNNMATADLRLAPGGGRLAVTLRYTNLLDYFETEELRYASSLAHEGMLDIAWHWLPKTALYAQVAQGYISYFEDDRDLKQNSFPLRAIAGLRGLVTPKLTVNVAAGYTTSFYEGEGADPSGLSNLAGLAELVFLPNPRSQILLGFRHEFRNSVVGNYFDVDTPYLGIRQLVGSQFALGAFGRYELRRYHGVTDMMGGGVDRNDQFVFAGANADYFFRSWIYAGIGYSVVYNNSDLEVTSSTLAGLDYTKQQVYGRLGFIY